MSVKRFYMLLLTGCLTSFLCFFSWGKPAKVWSASSVNAGKMIITEVSFNDSANDWIEIYVVDGSVDWTGYRIYEGTVNQITINSTLALNLTTGDYIVLHEETGTDETTDKGSNGYWDLYGLTDLYATDGVLQIKEPFGSTNRVDVVIFSDNNGSFSSSVTQANDAVADGMWNNYNFSTGDSGAWTDSDDLGSDETLSRFLDPGTPIYADGNTKDDWYHATIATKGGGSQQTIIELASLTATVNCSNVTIDWQTISEIDNAGFNLWRSESASGVYSKLNPTLISAQGSPTTGFSYTYIDSEISKDQIVYYKLEDQDLYGVSTLHGPVRVDTRSLYCLYLPLCFR